jgi:hypothetical protein
LAGMMLLGEVSAMPPAARCQNAKLWIAGRYVARHPHCRTTGCATAWTQRLRRSFANLERTLPCITRNDASRVESITRDFEVRLAAMLRRRSRPCARLFTASTARLAGVSIRSQRPVWPPQDRQFPEELHHAYDRFDWDREAAKALRGCRSVILGSKLNVPANLIQRRTIEALLPAEVATGLRVKLPPGWRLHDVSPGNATFVTFDGEYAHGSHEMPPGGADCSIYVTDRSVDDWLSIGGDRQSVEHTTIDGVDAIRELERFDDGQRRLNLLIPSERLGLQFNWHAGDDTEPQHVRDFEEILRTARFFARRMALRATVNPP